MIFEGGNLVCDEEFVYLGEDTLVLNAVRSGQNIARTVRQFEREFGYRIWVVGPSPQPIGHLDMMLAPLGRGRIVLADPNWGAGLAQKALDERTEEVLAFERQCREMFFGDRHSPFVYNHQGRKLLAPDTEGLTQDAVKHCREIGKTLDRIGQEFAQRGYDVIRVPYLSVSRANASKDPSDPNEVPACARYPEISYTNVLQESSGERRRVYLPMYGWAVFDRAATEVWQKAGFEVIPVNGFAISAMYGGSLRCCTKVLERSY